MKSLRIVAIVVALAISSCGCGSASPSQVASRPPATAALATASPTTSPPSPLEGMWTTPLLTCDQQLASIRKAGFTDAQIGDSGWGPCVTSVYYRVRFLGAHLVAFGRGVNEPFSVASEYSYELTDDHTLVLAESGTQLVMTLTFTLVGDVLTFTSQTNNGDLNSQVALPTIFLSAPFTKEP